MAKIVENIIVIKISKIVPEKEQDSTPAVTLDYITALVQVAQELAGSGVVVEVEQA
jgi:hypothetical protein